MKKLLILLSALIFTTSSVFAADVRQSLMTNVPPSSCGDYPAINTFSATTDTAAYFYIELDNVNTGDIGQYLWYYEGQLDGGPEPKVFNAAGDYCLYGTLMIRGTEAAYMGGNWSVEYYLNNVKISSQLFYLQGLSSGPCTAQAALGDDNLSLDILRKFRNETLKKTQLGQKSVELFYKHSPAIVKIMENNPLLKASARQFFKACAAVIDKFN